MSHADPTPLVRFRAVTLNVFHDIPFFRHVERRFDLIAEALLREQVDVAMLQEMFVSRTHGDSVTLLADALRRSGQHYEFFYAPANGSVANGSEFEEGPAVLSRFPILDADARFLAPDHEVWNEYRGYRFTERRLGVRATVRLAPDISMDFFSTHLSSANGGEPGSSHRDFQVKDLAHVVEQRPCRTLPAIIGGDLNARPEAKEIEFLRTRGFVDVCDGHESAMTNDSSDRDLEDPRETADQKIDYIFMAEAPPAEITVHAVRLFLGQAAELSPGRFLWASDHNGILADLVLK